MLNVRNKSICHSTWLALFLEEGGEMPVQSDGYLVCQTAREPDCWHGSDL